MAKKLASHFIELTQDACLKAFWRRRALRTFLKQHGISEEKLATWHADETKREFLRRLFDDLIRDTKGHQVILGMSRSLAEMRHFPDLEGWPDSREKLAAAKEAIARIKVQVDSLNQQVRVKKASEERQRVAREQREQAILAQQTLAGLAERLNELVSKQGTQVSEVRDFLHLLKSSPETKRRIILSNIHTRLDAISRYENDPFAEDVPF